MLYQYYYVVVVGAVLPELGSLRQEDCFEFQASLSYSVRSYLKTHKHKVRGDKLPKGGMGQTCVLVTPDKQQNSCLLETK